MQIHYTFRKIEATDAIKTHVEKKIIKFSKFISYPVEFYAMLCVEKGGGHRAELKCHAEHRELVAQAKSRNLYESIDQAAHKLENQLKRERERKKGHLSAHLSSRSSSLRTGTDVAIELPHREKKLRRTVIA